MATLLSRPNPFRQLSYMIHVRQFSRPYLRRRVLYVALSTILAFAISANAQWTSEWISPSISTSAVSGWLLFHQAGSQQDYRYYALDSLNFVIMTDVYSSTPAYSYTFTAAERTAGNLLYSLGIDLTGDDITEFYVLGAYGTTGAYRQGFKIFDVTTGATIFERNSAAYDYGYPTIWDADGDGVLECTFSKADYPAGANYVNEVFNTSVSISSAGGGVIPRQIRLGQNFPNPFNPSTQIEFDLLTPGVVELDVYNLLGQKVSTLVNGLHMAGHHSIAWNGRTDSGESATSGHYYYMLKVDGKASESRRMILLR